MFLRAEEQLSGCTAADIPPYVSSSTSSLAFFTICNVMVLKNSSVFILKVLFNPLTLFDDTGNLASALMLLVMYILVAVTPNPPLCFVPFSLSHHKTFT